MKYIFTFLGLSLLYPFAFLLLLIEALWYWEFKYLKSLNKNYVERFWSVYFRLKRKS